MIISWPKRLIWINWETWFFFFLSSSSTQRRSQRSTFSCVFYSLCNLFLYDGVVSQGLLLLFHILSGSVAFRHSIIVFLISLQFEFELCTAISVGKNSPTHNPYILFILYSVKYEKKISGFLFFFFKVKIIFMYFIYDLEKLFKVKTHFLLKFCFEILRLSLRLKIVKSW